MKNQNYKAWSLAWGYESYCGQSKSFDYKFELVRACIFLNLFLLLKGLSGISSNHIDLQKSRYLCTTRRQVVRGETFLLIFAMRPMKSSSIAQNSGNGFHEYSQTSPCHWMVFRTWYIIWCFGVMGKKFFLKRKLRTASWEDACKKWLPAFKIVFLLPLSNHKSCS